MCRHPIRIPAAFVAVTLLSAGTAAADQCLLEPASAARGQEVRLKLENAGVTLARIAVAGKPGQPPTVVTAEIKNKEATFVVPRLPLGDYTVSATLSAAAAPAETAITCPPLILHVAPPAGSTLQVFEFQPGGTGSFKDLTWKNADDSNVTTRVANLTIRGSGFITDPDFRDDNHILIDHEPRKVQWITTPCPAPGTNPPENQAPPIKAYLASVNEIQVCDVPFAHHTIAVSVAQSGVAQTPRRTFRLYRWHTSEVARIAAIVSVLLALLVLGLVKIFKRNQSNASQYNTLKILLLDLETDTYSLSKLQFYLWTGAAVFGYVYLAISHLVVQGLGWPEIPSSLPGIIAIGASTAIGAQIVNNVRGPKGSGSTEPSLGDLVTSGGVAAPDRVQMLVWTVVGVGFFLGTVVRQPPEVIVTLDKVPDGLMLLMGLSSVGYLGGKMARKAGPIINEVSITPSEPDDALAGALVAPSGAASNLAGAVVAANGTLAALSGATSEPAKAAVKQLNAAIAAATAAKTVSSIVAARPVLKQTRDDGRLAAEAAAKAFESNNPQPDSGPQAELAQTAAAALDDLFEAAEADSSKSSNIAPGAPRFTRTIELRGRNLSSLGLFEIDGVELPFRMLQPDPLDQNKKRVPELVIKEPDDPSMGIVLRLTIDPSDLEPSDRMRYDKWFATASATPKLLRLINLDGQQDDLAFTMPPATAQSPVKTNQPSPGGAAGGGK